MNIGQYLLHSRIHLLNSFPPNSYVKREDELSCGISGNKLRKYASLIPYWKHNNIQHLICIASPHSNNLLAVVQTAREHQLSITAFLLKPWSEAVQGNFQLSQMFLEDEDIVWVTREDWPKVEEQAIAHQATLDGPSYVLREGASNPEALPGAMTLADDILRNELEAGVDFSHIYTDAGTGFSALALAHRLKQLGHHASIICLLMAGTERDFHLQARRILGYAPDNLELHRPLTARSFGAINQTVRNEIRRCAKEEGILLDPIYNAKLFLSCRTLIQERNTAAAHLIIHSGGTLSLCHHSITR